MGLTVPTRSLASGTQSNMNCNEVIANIAN